MKVYWAYLTNSKFRLWDAAEAPGHASEDRSMLHLRPHADKAVQFVMLFQNCFTGKLQRGSAVGRLTDSEMPAATTRSNLGDYDRDQAHCTLSQERKLSSNLTAGMQTSKPRG